MRKWVLLTILNFWGIFYLGSAQAAVGDIFVFMPSAQDFKKCSLAREWGATAHQEGNNVRIYFKTNPGARAWFIHFHGNGESACARMVFLRFLKEKQEQYNFAFVEYPGYSNDPVRASEPRILKNALEAFEVIKRKNAENGENLPLVVYGESMGSTVALYVTSHNENDVDRVILQAPFPSIRDVANSFIPFLPLGRTLDSHFPARKWAPLVKAPVTIFHGQNDWVVPLRLGKKLAEYLTATTVDFQIIPRGGHNDLLKFPLFQEKLMGELDF